MKTNLARKKLLDGGVISGPSLYFPCPEIVEKALQYGFDFVWLDWQHGGWTEPTLSAALACFVNRDTVGVVRPPGADPATIGRLLDLGALGVIIPMVETVEQCEAIVRAAKFPPRGGRSATGLRTAYHAGHNYVDYTENANDQILTIVMVETPAGVRNVREMMKVPDVDCVLIGPYDLSRAVGAATMSEPAVEELVQEVLQASRQTGTAAGYVTGNPAEAERRVAEGFRMVCPGHDVSHLPAAFREMQRCSQQLSHTRRRE